MHEASGTWKSICEKKVSLNLFNMLLEYLHWKTVSKSLNYLFELKIIHDEKTWRNVEVIINNGYGFFLH